MKYGKITFGQMEAIINKLGGIEGVNNLLSGKIHINNNRVFEVWTTIKLGTQKNFVALINSLRRDGVCFHNNWGGDISLTQSTNLTVASVEKEINLVAISVKDFGFEYGTSLKEIYNKAKKQGLRLCPAEVGPQLRLQYKLQPSKERLLIAMKPIMNSNLSLEIFCLGKNNDNLFLAPSILLCGLDSFFDKKSVFVFCLP